MDNLYLKTVPLGVREYIELKSGGVDAISTDRNSKEKARNNASNTGQK